MPRKQSDSVPVKMQPIYDEITALTDAVCRRYLDEEYAQLARKMTAANKARTVRDVLKVGQADPNWWRPSNMEKNPFAWWVSVNGLVVDARKLPLHIQEQLAGEGIIPFVPSRKEAIYNDDASEHSSSDNERR